jgi:hypothetical protein
MEDAGEQLLELVFAGLDHGIESVRVSRGPLIPFVMTEGPSGRQIQRFAAERLENALEQAHEFYQTARHVSERAILVYDGYTRVSDIREDAIFTMGSGNNDRSFLFAQRYSPKAFLHGFESIGNALYLGEGRLELVVPEPGKEGSAVLKFESQKPSAES